MAGTGMDWKGGTQEGGKDSGSMVGLASASLNQDSGADKGKLWKGKTLVDPQDGNGCLVGPVSTGLNHDKAVMEVSTGGPARAGLSPASDVLRLGKRGHRGDVTEDSVGLKVGETDSQVGLARAGLNLTSGPTGNDS